MDETIKNLTPKIAVAASVLGASLILAPSAFAAEASNSNTGAGSDNEAKVEVKNDISINQSNKANINNKIYVNANTGGNSASKNTGDGSVQTGDINGSVDIVNKVNDNTLNNIGFDCDGLCLVFKNVSTSNKNTGADSKNESSVEINNDVDVTQENDLDIDNDVEADLDTGNNSADENTGDGSVKTGDINFEVKITNKGNENIIGGPSDDPGKPGENPKGPDAVVPTKPKDDGKVLAAAEGLPVTGGSLPLLPAFALMLAGLAMRRVEETLRLRFSKERN